MKHPFPNMHSPGYFTVDGIQMKPRLLPRNFNRSRYPQGVAKVQSKGGVVVYQPSPTTRIRGFTRTRPIDSEATAIGTILHRFKSKASRIDSKLDLAEQKRKLRNILKQYRKAIKV